MYRRLKAYNARQRRRDTPGACNTAAILSVLLTVLWLWMAIAFDQPLDYLTAAVWAVVGYVWFKRAVRARTNIAHPPSGWYRDPWGAAANRYYDSTSGWTGWVA